LGEDEHDEVHKKGEKKKTRWIFRKGGHGKEKLGREAQKGRPESKSFNQKKITYLKEG